MSFHLTAAQAVVVMVKSPLLFYKMLRLALSISLEHAESDLYPDFL